MDFKSRQCLTLAALITALAVNASGGDITGTVLAKGKDVPGKSGKHGTYDSRKHKFIETIDYDRMKGFVVYIESDVEGERTPPAAPLTVVAHRNATFLPHVIPVMVGTTVAWPNEDDFYHNAFSISEAKPFDLGLYKEEVKKVLFDKPGRVDVFCSIHKNMNCVILVLENPFFATTDDRGRFTIRDIPAGTYTVKAWHERMPAQTRQIVVPETGSTQVDFIMGIQGLPHY